MTKIKKTLRRLIKNTLLTIGIIGCNLFLVGSAGSRVYEIQFFTVKFHNRLDYDRLQKMGIAKIIYRVFQDSKPDGGLYFTNTQFRTLQPALEQLIAEFDFKRFDLCAWMIGRKFEWISDTFLFDYQYEKGQRQQVRKLDMFNPDAVKKLITVYKELASNRIDCILIQDDFILRYNEGFSSWGKAQFTNATKVPAKEKLMMADDTPYSSNWQRVKIDQLNKILQLIVKNCKMVNSGIRVGINIYYETPLFVKRAEAWYSHNLEEILHTGVDYIYLMSYHRQIKDEMKLSEKRNRLLFKQIVERAFQICKEKLVVKLQLRDWNTGRRIPAEEVRAYLRLIPSGVERVCFTPVKVEDFNYLEGIIKSSL